MTRAAVRLAQLILAGVPELYAADTGSAERAWRDLARLAHLERQEPFGFPSYWTPTDASIAWAQRKMRGRTDAELAAVAYRRKLRTTGAAPTRRRVA